MAKLDGTFDPVTNSKDPDEAFEMFEIEYRKILDKHAPLKVIQNRSNYVPYLTPNIRKYMEERNKLKEKAALSGDSDDYDAYKRKRNFVSKLLKTAERDYYSNKFNEDGSSKTIWRTAFEILGTQRTSFPSQIFHMGQLISSPKDIAAAVNEFFVSKIAPLSFSSRYILLELKALSVVKNC